MWTSIVLSILYSVAFASELEIFDNNGWIPVRSDVVFNQIKRGITQTPQYTKADNVPILNTDILSIISPPMKFEFDLLPNEHISGEHIDECHSGDSATCVNGPRPEVEYDFYQNKFHPTLSQNLQANTAVRRSKKLADIEAHAFIKDVVLPKHGKYGDENTHTYEVTENIIQEESVIEKTGYEYHPPEKLNFTGSLLKYLLKYNINDSDTLQNYALSRRPKSQSPVKLNLLPPHPIRHNSLNHLAVDPLIAVFLSNYGYYLQGQYGIQNNYNNLYGYLASNNIHNNRPFGFYKLFSDTDSSNK